MASMFAAFESNVQELSAKYAAPIDQVTRASRTCPHVQRNTIYARSQVRFLSLILLGYPLGAVYRYGLHPSRTSVTVRHLVSTSLGILFGLLCFGWSQMSLLFLMTGVCYAMLVYLPASIVHLYTIVFAMACVSVGHVYRMVTDYEGWNIDFSV